MNIESLRHEYDHVVVEILEYSFRKRQEMKYLLHLEKGEDYRAWYK